MGKRPIDSRKHIVDSEGGITTSLSQNVVALAVTATSPGTFIPTEVVIGSKITSMFISIFIIGSTGAPVNASQNWYLIKTYTGQSVPQPGATGNSDLRNQIIHEEKGLVGSGDGTAMAFKGVIRIPRGLQTMRSGDAWSIVLAQQSGTDPAEFCLKVIYKDYR